MGTAILLNIPIMNAQADLCGLRHHSEKSQDPWRAGDEIGIELVMEVVQGTAPVEMLREIVGFPV